MVLQQGLNSPVWGTSMPGQTLVIEFAGTITKTKANQNGHWVAKLPKLKAGGPFRLTIASSKDSVVCKNVMIGEVWLASGQSNMQMAISEVNNAKEQDKLQSEQNPKRFVFEK